MPALDSSKPEISNNYLRIHFVNVDHGDAIILELPDYQDFSRRDVNFAHYAVVDTGRHGNTKNRLSRYLRTLAKVRNMEYCIDFVCITHPHDDHYGGLDSLLYEFDGEIRQFWDCGFRTTAANYNKALEKIAGDDRILFLRPAAGMEFEFGKVRIFTLGPSLDLRNRFDTYGVNRNNASIVLKIQFGNSVAILSGDAQFDSWGKIAEEFPRSSKTTYFTDASVSRSEGDNQLECQLLKVSHHGSRHGTNLEYLEKLRPTHFMITCADTNWYAKNKSGWTSAWPHDLTALAIKEVNKTADIKYSYKDKNVIYELKGTTHLQVRCFDDDPDSATFYSNLEATLFGF
jgi:competence protein ComEC